MTEASTAQKPASSNSQIFMMMMIFATMFITFDPGMRNVVGDLAGIILRPIIEFDEQFPVMTVFLAGLFLVSFSSIVRDYFINQNLL